MLYLYCCDDCFRFYKRRNRGSAYYYNIEISKAIGDVELHNRGTLPRDAPFAKSLNVISYFSADREKLGLCHPKSATTEIETTRYFME
jgi:hypothetical protein